MKESYKVEGTIIDSKGHSIKFTEKDILILEIETGDTKRIVNNRYALKLQKLIKERINQGHPKFDGLVSDEVYQDLQKQHHSTNQTLQSLIDKSEK